MVADGSRAKRVRYGLERQRFDYDGMKDLEIRLAGQYQVGNAILAIETCRALSEQGYEISEKALRQGLLETRWPGRFTILGRKPLFVVDGAHNEDAAKKLARSIEFYFTNKRIIYIMGILKDKEYEKIIDLTAHYADQILTVAPPGNPRAMGSYELAQEGQGAPPSDCRGQPGGGSGDQSSAGRQGGRDFGLWFPVLFGEAHGDYGRAGEEVKEEKSV